MRGKAAKKNRQEVALEARKKDLKKYTNYLQGEDLIALGHTKESIQSKIEKIKKEIAILEKRVV